MVWARKVMGGGGEAESGGRVGTIAVTKVREWYDNRAYFIPFRTPF